MHTYADLAHLNPSNDRLAAENLYLTSELAPWTAEDVARFHQERLSEKHWRHWRWLHDLPHGRYLRALSLWRSLFQRFPRGIVLKDGTARLNLEVVQP